MRILVVAVSIIMLACSVSSAADRTAPSLLLAEVGGKPGDTIVLPLSYMKGAGAPLSAVGVDISYDSSRLDIKSAVLPNIRSREGRLKIAANSPAQGVFRIALFSDGKGSIEEGAVAEISLLIRQESKKGEVELVVSPSGASPDGKAVAIESSRTKVRVE